MDLTEVWIIGPPFKPYTVYDCSAFAGDIVRKCIIQRINRKQNGKAYTSIILTKSYREGGKQKRQTLAVLTKWSTHLIAALEAALKNKTAADFQNF